MGGRAGDPSAATGPEVGNPRAAQIIHATKTTRTQWSSCDFCRSRKKKCDALKRREQGSDKCSRCLEYDTECTFTFVSQKSTIRTAKRRQSLAAKQVLMPVIDDSQNAIDMSMLQVPLEDAELYTVDDIGDPIPMLYDNEAISRSNFLPAELMEPIISTTLTQFNTESQQAGAVPSTFSMTDEEVLSILYPDFTTPLPTLSPKNHFCETSQELHQTGSCSFGPEPVAPFVPALILQRTASGLSKDLEWSMIQEYARLGHTQMPVVDIDMIFLRYRYRTPSILPDYFVLALVACGSHYSSQRLEPGIDRQAAQHLYESARKELMVAAVSEQSVDALTALFIVYFHWQGDLTAFERGRLLALSVQKLLALGLHRERDLCLGRSPRDRGVVRYLVWLIYIVDAFSGSSGPAVGDLEPAKEPFQGAEIELEQVSKNDMEAMTRDLLTGELRTGWNLMHTEFSILFNRAFATLSQLQNKIVRLQRAGQSVQHLRSELFDFETGAFSSCDLAYRTWDYERLVYVEFGGLTAAVISLNFAFWYCSLNLHFDNLRSHLAMDTSSASPSSSGPTVLGDNLNEASVRACCKASTSTLSIFETLCTGSRLYQTSQVIRGQLYLAGRVLQIFYRNRVKCSNVLVVDSFLLSRWERCLEISELVWGYSSRGIDLGRMSLEEIE